MTEAKPPVQWNKGHAAIYILRAAFGVDWSDRNRMVIAYRCSGKVWSLRKDKKVDHFSFSFSVFLNLLKDLYNYLSYTVVFLYFYLFRIRIIYAGDDLTDEDAMQALKVSRDTFELSYIISKYFRWNPSSVFSIQDGFRPIIG